MERHEKPKSKKGMGLDNPFITTYKNSFPAVNLTPFNKIYEEDAGNFEKEYIYASLDV